MRAICRDLGSAIVVAFATLLSAPGETRCPDAPATCGGASAVSSEECEAEADMPSPFPGDPLRIVQLDGEPYTLAVWYSRPDPTRHGSMLAYQLIGPWGVIFSGADYGPAPSLDLDGDDCLRGLLSFLTLRPGDTDSEYFEKYTGDQLWFASNAAEDLSIWALEPDDNEIELPGFVDLAYVPGAALPLGPFCRFGA